MPARRHHCVDVAPRSVHVLKNLDVAREAFGCESFSDIHLQLRAHLVGGKQRHAFEVHRANFVLRSLVDHELQPEPIRRVIDILHVPKFKVDVARIAIKVRQLFPVFIQLIRLQHA